MMRVMINSFGKCAAAIWNAVHTRTHTPKRLDAVQYTDEQIFAKYNSEVQNEESTRYEA